MQKVLTLFIILISLTSFSQNWSLIKGNTQSHYFVSNDHVATIKVDSIATSGTDTLFYLNRIIVECDTCSVWSYYLFNQGNFLQKKVLKEDSVYRFFDTTSFAIIPNATIGVDWVFDTVNNITATASSYYENTILGEVDSMRTITLSNNGKIYISKRFGIERFLNTPGSDQYALKGVQGLENVGYYVPDMDDYYYYQIGDVFYYNENWWSVGGEYGQQFFYQAKTITHTDSTVIMEIDGCRNRNPQQWPVYDDFYDSTIIIQKKKYANGLLNQYTPFDEATFDGSDVYETYEVGSEIGVNVILSETTDGSVEKRYDFVFIDTFSIDDMTQRREWASAKLKYYGKSFEYSEYMFENSYSLSNRYAYNTHLDSFSCEQLLHSIPEIKINEHFSIAPNPANAQITINRGSVLEPYEITVYNLQGQLIKSDTWKAGLKAKALNVASLPKGMYLVKFNSNNKIIGEEKFIKVE